MRAKQWPFRCLLATPTFGGVEQETKSVTLAAGASQTVSFSVTPEIVGTFDIKIGSLTDSLTVLQSAPYPVYLAGGWEWQNPLPQGSSLSSVWGSAADDVYVVGTNGAILHYDGSEWTEVYHSEDVILISLWGTSSTDIYALGFDNATGDLATLHYDGTDWAQMDTGLPASTTFPSNVWGSAATGIFIAGDDGLILYYDGTAWTQMDTGIYDYIDCIWGSASDDVYALSGWDGIIFHYDGESWTQVTIAPDSISLNGIWGSSATNIFIVGDDGLIIHHGGETG